MDPLWQLKQLVATGARDDQGQQEPRIYVGNLDSVRTFADVRDAVEAYLLLVDKCQPGEVYNIGGNQTMTIRDMLNKLLDLTSMKIEVHVSKDLLRPSDVTLQIPSVKKFEKLTGWRPKIPFDQTLEDTLNFWRGRV